jgi:uncharacterized protein (UPF0212 family)
MEWETAHPVELEIGTYVCPNSKRETTLKASHPLAFVHWPVVVEACPDCGQAHEINLADVKHLPVYGYE